MQKAGVGLAVDQHAHGLLRIIGQRSRGGEPVITGLAIPRGHREAVAGLADVQFEGLVGSKFVGHLGFSPTVLVEADGDPIRRARNDSEPGAESGLAGYEVVLWHGLVGPKGLPRAIVDRINAEANQILKVKEMDTLLATDGVAAAGGTPEQFAATIKSDIERWGKVVKQAGVKVD